MSGTRLDSKSSGTEDDIKKVVQQKCDLLSDLDKENRQYELKRLALEKDLADLEVCEIIMREKLIMKKKQELNETNNVFESNLSKVSYRHYKSLIIILSIFQ